MSVKQASRDLIHAQLRLASTDDMALDDAIRYVTRALGALFDAKASRTPTVVELEEVRP
jgi:hypothetical protein